MADDDTPQETDDPTDQHEEHGLSSDEMAAELARARKDAAKYRQQARAAERERDDLKVASQSEQERAVAQARREGELAALEKANARLVRAEVTAAAAGKMADPSDALGMLDLDEFAVDDGDVDRKAIAKAIDDLVKAKPYLAAGPRPNGSFDGGARATAEKSDMNALIRDRVRR